jgi:hypothetical protein
MDSFSTSLNETGWFFIFLACFFGLLLMVGIHEKARMWGGCLSAIAAGFAVSFAAHSFLWGTAATVAVCIGASISLALGELNETLKTRHKD